MTSHSLAVTLMVLQNDGSQLLSHDAGVPAVVRSADIDDGHVTLNIDAQDFTDRLSRAIEAFESALLDTSSG